MAAAVAWIAVFVVSVLLALSLVALFWTKRRPAEAAGLLGEFQTRFFHLRRLDGTVYKIFNDVYLPHPEGVGTTQVDHIVVSQHGLVVIETKNLSGWLFGSRKGSHWTITYRSRPKTRIWNPLRQNRVHADAVVEALDVPPEVVDAVVFLVGDGTPRSLAAMGPDVLHRHGLVERITAHQEPRLDAETVQRCRDHLDAATSAGWQILRRRRLRQRHQAGIAVRAHNRARAETAEPS